MSNKLNDEDLLALSGVFDQSLEISDPDGYEDLPDGDYMCQVVQLEITKTKSTDRLMAAWRFQVMEGEEGEGRYIFKNAVLEGDNGAKNMKRLISDVNKFGLEVSSLPGLLEVMGQVSDEFCLVQLKTGKTGGQWVTIDVPEMD